MNRSPIDVWCDLCGAMPTRFCRPIPGTPSDRAVDLGRGIAFHNQRERRLGGAAGTRERQAVEDELQRRGQ